MALIGRETATAQGSYTISELAGRRIGFWPPLSAARTWLNAFASQKCDCSQKGPVKTGLIVGLKLGVNLIGEIR